MARTWLGTNEVNGATTGFTGRGEVLGFELPSQRSMPVFLGFYKGGGSSEANYEHIGETIIYKTTLTDAERLTVQEYLMAKWLGDYGSKYSDLSGITVTGDGVVKSASLRNFPQFDAGVHGNPGGRWRARVHDRPCRQYDCGYGRADVRPRRGVGRRGHCHCDGECRSRHLHARHGFVSDGWYESHAPAY